MKPEYVDEMPVDEPTAIKLKAACVWKLVGAHYTQEELAKYCNLYGISINDALKWRKKIFFSSLFA